MSKYKKGQSGNPNGRPKGSKGRNTEEMRSFIQSVVDKNYDRLEEDLDNMNPTNRWKILEGLTKYFLPALSKNDNNNVHQGDIQINVKFDELPPINDKEVL